MTKPKKKMTPDIFQLFMKKFFVDFCTKDFCHPSNKRRREREEELYEEMRRKVDEKQ